jgi:hypothetical protein
MGQTGKKNTNEDENGTLDEEPRTMKKENKGTSEWEEGKNKGKMRSFVETRRATRGRRARGSKSTCKGLRGWADEYAASMQRVTRQTDFDGT